MTKNPMNITGDGPDASILQDLVSPGYHRIEQLIAPTQANEARQILLDIAAAEMEGQKQPVDFQRVTQIVNKHPLFLDLLMNERLLHIWRAYLGQDMVCSSWTGIILHPGHPDYSWHVDYPYWSMKPPYPPYDLAGQTIWMLDDFTEDNGGTGVVPDSHRRGTAPAYGNCWPDEAAVVTGNRGDVVVGDGAWWHCSRPNKTDKPRVGLLCMFVRGFVITQENMRAQLEALSDPSDDVRQILGGNQHKQRAVSAY